MESQDWSYSVYHWGRSVLTSQSFLRWNQLYMSGGFLVNRQKHPCTQHYGTLHRHSICVSHGLCHYLNKGINWKRGRFCVFCDRSYLMLFTTKCMRYPLCLLHTKVVRSFDGILWHFCCFVVGNKLRCMLGMVQFFSAAWNIINLENHPHHQRPKFKNSSYKITEQYNRLKSAWEH